MKILVRVTVVLCLAATITAQKRGFTAEDYFALKAASDPQVSPDGKLAAFVLTTADQKLNRRPSDIWTVALDGSHPARPFTTSQQSSSAPRWSPDGQSVAFVSTRGEGARPQVFLLAMTGGEARQVTRLKNGVQSCQWSPDGTRMACVSRTGPSDEPRPEGSEPRSDVRHYTHIRYKFNDTGWFDDRRAHIWVVNVASGEAKQITSGDDWDDTDPQWSPDSTRIAFVSNRTGKAYDDDTNSDVWVIPAAGGALVKISDHVEPDTNPRWSPDGTQIAFLSGDENSFPQIWLAPSNGGGTSRKAARALDMIPTDLSWAADGRSLQFAAGTHGVTHLFQVDLASGAVSQVTRGERAVRSASRHAKSGLMVYLANDFQHPDDIYVARLSGADERRLTGVNGDLLHAREAAAVERLPFKSADGTQIDGFLVKPVGWQEGKKYPMVLSIHGGPAGMYGVDWYHEFQVYAAKGWAVFFTNPRGSTGYGAKFQRAVALNWGGKAYDDIMSGVDAVLAKHSWIDVDRLGVTGGSYGGFMTNWIVSHNNRFKAAVTLRSISNFISDDGTRDGAYGHKRDFGGDIFENYIVYWETSPLKHVKNVKTPTLVLHSDNDLRVPLEQGEQWFRALQLFGVTSEFVIFPRENHNLTRNGEPRHLVDSIRWQCYWFERFLNGNGAAKGPL